MKRILFILLIGLLPFSIKAQVTRSVYFMDHVPIANLINPSFTNEYKFYVNSNLIFSSKEAIAGLMV